MTGSWTSGFIVLLGLPGWLEQENMAMVRTKTIGGLILDKMNSRAVRMAVPWNTKIVKRENFQEEHSFSLD
jgi:hypothetical protein